MRLLRAAWPRTSLRLLARRGPGFLLRDAGVVDAAFDADDAAWRGLFDAGAAAPPPAAEADAALGWFHNPTGFAAVGRGAVEAIVYEAGSGLSLSRYFFERTAALVRARRGTPADFEACRLLFAGPPPPRERFAILHPGSGGRAKRWPLDRFLAVAGALAADGLAGRLVTGEAEEGLAPGLSAAALPPGWDRVPLPTLSALAADLRRAAVYVGNDSGVTHLAAACGTPSVAIFRDEHLPAWRPAGPVTVLSAPRPGDVPVEAVMRAVGAVLDGIR